MNDKIEVKIDGQTKELIIREGSALEIKPPVAISIIGTIDAPRLFITAKKDILKPINSTLLVDINAGKLSFISDETSFYASKVTGLLKKAKAISEIGINDVTKFYSDKALAKFIRQHIFYFSDKEKALALITALMKFSAKISTSIKNEADLKGNMKLAFERIVSTGLPETIDVCCKVYEGLPAETFTVNICVEAEASDLKFYFDSPQLYELEEQIKNDTLKAESESFVEWGCAVINI